MCMCAHAPQASWTKAVVLCPADSAARRLLSYSWGGCNVCLANPWALKQRSPDLGEGLHCGEPHDMGLVLEALPHRSDGLQVALLRDQSEGLQRIAPHFLILVPEAFAQCSEGLLLRWDC